MAEARSLLSRAIAADPEHKSRWEQALAGASVGEDYAAARAAIQRGQFDAAERQLRGIIARGGDVGGAQAMLADALGRRGDLAGAEAPYRAMLARQPNNADALVGLAQVLGKQGRGAEAEALLDRAQSTGDSRAVGRIRTDALRQQAAATKDPIAKEALLRAAAAAVRPTPGPAGTCKDVVVGRQETGGAPGHGGGYKRRQPKQRCAAGRRPVRGRGRQAE